MAFYSLVSLNNPRLIQSRHRVLLLVEGLYLVCISSVPDIHPVCISLFFHCGTVRLVMFQYLGLESICSTHVNLCPHSKDLILLLHTLSCLLLKLNAFIDVMTLLFLLFLIACSMFLVQAIPAMLLTLVLCFDYRKSRDMVSLSDLHSSKGHKYICYALPGYAIGLIISLVAGVLTHSPQPALLYLVCTCNLFFDSSHSFCLAFNLPSYTYILWVALFSPLFQHFL